MAAYSYYIQDYYGDAIAELEKKFSKDEDVKIFITSVKKSSRGIHR